MTDRGSARLCGATPLFGVDLCKSAVLSPCWTYRYELTRRWSSRPLVGWVMLNPSTADAEADDPTVRRCVRFANAWGYGGLVIRNLFALRATDPSELGQLPACPRLLRLATRGRPGRHRAWSSISVVVGCR